jgi:hypothetical protein
MKSSHFRWSSVSYLPTWIQPEGNRKKDAISEEVIRQIREKAYEAEDVIDKYILIKTSKHSSNRGTRGEDTPRGLAAKKSLSI